MVQEHLGDPACQRRWGLLERGRSTPRARPFLLAIPFHLASLWLLEVHSVLVAHHGPETRRHQHQEVPQVPWLLSPLEVPGHPSLQWGQVVPEVPEVPECQANPGLQAPPGAPALPFLEALALPVRPSVLGALELPVDQAGRVYQVGPRLRGPDLLWGPASQAVPPCWSAPLAGWGRQCSHHPFLLLAPQGPELQALPTVPAAPWCPGFQGLQDSQHHPSAPSAHALQPCPVFLAGRSREAQAPPFLLPGQARPPHGRPHPEGWTGLRMAHKAPPLPL